MEKLSLLHSRQPKRPAWSPEKFAERRALVLGMKLDHRTWRSYSSAYNSWADFTSKHDFPIHPNPTTFSNYVMYMCDFIKPDSVVSYLSGIVKFLEPFFPDIHEVRGSQLVADTIIGCKRLRHASTIRKSPLTVQMLSTIVARSGSSYDDLLFQALILVGFHSLLRLGDLCDPDMPSLHNPAKRARRSSVRSINPHALAYTLPAHKADKFFEGNTVLVSNFWPALDNLSIFKSYLSRRDRHHPFASPLWLTEDGTVPDRKFFQRHLRRFNLDGDIGGQSMRAGGATALAQLGAPTYVIQAMGRWSSNAWRIYIRKHPAMLFNFNDSTTHAPQHRP